MAVTYYALLTTIGAAKLANAAALGTTLKITQLAVGDGAGSVPAPDASRTALVNEVRRAPLNTLSIDAANSSQIIAEQVIPEDVGGWWIREMGLFDDVGALIAYANCAPSYKPQLAEGSGRTQTVRMVLIVTSTGAVELKIDPSVVLATRSYVDTSIADALGKLDYKQSARYATTANISLSGLATQAGGDWPAALTAGDRVLVKNQTTASQNGLYVVAAGAWPRATDADSSAEVTPGMVVVIESGTLLADTIWQLITDAPIVVGTTALTFQDITNGLARLLSPAFVGTPSAPTPAQFDNSQLLATTAFVNSLGLKAAGAFYINATTTLTAAHCGGLVVALGASPITLTLPLLSAVPDGARIEIINDSVSSTITVSRQGTDVLSFTPTGSYTSWDLRNGESLTLTKITIAGNSSWMLCAGSALLKNTGGFASSLAAASGYQKLPSGLIIQWGLFTTGGTIGAPLFITFPLAFSTACRAVLITPDSNGSATISAWVDSMTLTGFNARCNIASQPNTHWMAIGY